MNEAESFEDRRFINYFDDDVAGQSAVGTKQRCYADVGEKACGEYWRNDQSLIQIAVVLSE